MYVNNDIVCSDHFLLCIDIDCDIPPIYIMKLCLIVNEMFRSTNGNLLMK